MDFVARFPGRDDDAIARALRISPRQTVNLVAREFVKEGRLIRQRGPSGQLVNYPADVRVSTDGHPSIEGARDGEVSSEHTQVWLTIERLVTSGFRLSAYWTLD